MTNDDLDFFSASARLAACTELDVPAMELLYRLECSGEDFYNALADRIGNEEAGDLLRKNGREELGHARRVQRAISIRIGAEYEPSAEVRERFVIPLPDTIGLDPDLPQRHATNTAFTEQSLGHVEQVVTSLVTTRRHRPQD